MCNRACPSPWPGMQLLFSLFHSTEKRWVPQAYLQLMTFVWSSVHSNPMPVFPTTVSSLVFLGIHRSHKELMGSLFPPLLSMALILGKEGPELSRGKEEQTFRIIWNYSFSHCFDEEVLEFYPTTFPQGKKTWW